MKTLRYLRNIKGGLVKSDECLELQTRLTNAGFPCTYSGLFGPNTHDQVMSFQMSNGLVCDGIVGPKTWAAIGALSALPLDASVPQEPIEHEELPGFRGDWEWIHAKKEHRGVPYWPGGKSGVTLDPGFDLRYATKNKLNVLYYQILGTRALSLLEEAIGLEYTMAQKFLHQHLLLKDIATVTRPQACQLFPVIARPYWEQITCRFPILTAEDTPPAVQTALLSLAYNRGAGNDDLGQLYQPLQDDNWRMVGDRIKNMQQTGQPAWIGVRRREEGDLILAGLDSSR